MGDIYDRQRNYADLAQQLEKLGSMPERTKSKDLFDAASALQRASDDIKQLMRTQPHGCTCRYMEDDGRSWVVYDDKCQHHRWMLEEIGRVNAHCAEQIAKVKASTRLDLFRAALAGAAGLDRSLPPHDVARRALAIAEAALAVLLETKTTATP